MNIEQLVARAFPGPSPAAFLQRRTCIAIVRAANAQERATELLRRVAEVMWTDLPGLWIRPLRLEMWLAIAAADCGQASRDCREAAEALAEARLENQLAMLWERSLERSARARD